MLICAVGNKERFLRQVLVRSAKMLAEPIRLPYD